MYIGRVFKQLDNISAKPQHVVKAYHMWYPTSLVGGDIKSETNHLQISSDYVLSDNYANFLAPFQMMLNRSCYYLQIIKPSRIIPLITNQRTHPHIIYSSRFISFLLKNIPLIVKPGGNGLPMSGKLGQVSHKFLSYKTLLRWR